MANAISVARLFLTLPFTWFMLYPDTRSALYAAILFLTAIATDLIDGSIARRGGTTSPLGRALDHGADFCFVTSGLAAASLRGAIPWFLPALITLAFLQYASDSVLARGRLELRMSRLGRCNGILYFVPLGGDILVRLGLTGLGTPVVWVSWMLVVTTLLSMGDRLRSLALRLRKAHGSPGGER
jgi:phosphatidylglycerophosphate synthase